MDERQNVWVSKETICSFFQRTNTTMNMFIKDKSIISALHITIQDVTGLGTLFMCIGADACLFSIVSLYIE